MKMKKLHKTLFITLLAVLMSCDDAIDIRQVGRLDAVMHLEMSMI